VKLYEICPSAARNGVFGLCAALRIDLAKLNSLLRRPDTAASVQAFVAHTASGSESAAISYKSLDIEGAALILQIEHGLLNLLRQLARRINGLSHEVILNGLERRMRWCRGWLRIMRSEFLPSHRAEKMLRTILKGE
jgi:hypothetical protein